MKLSNFTLTLSLLASLGSSLSLRSTRYPKDAIARREAEAEADVLSGPIEARFDEELLSYLEKRRGGGGSSGGGGGHSSGGSSSSGSSSSGSSGSSSGSSGSSSGSSGSSGAGKSGGGSSGSTGGGSRGAGGSSSAPSVARPAYGGGRYYGGGATSSYSAGRRSPLGLTPILLGGALALAIFPGLWLYGAYSYPYTHPYNFHNRTANRNESLPVKCLCEEYSACGCDDNNNSTFLDSIVGDGNPKDMNSTLVHVANVNGTKTLVINGTLPNGTDDGNSSTGNATSSGGSASSGSMRQVAELSGFWVVGAIVGATIWLL